MNEVRLKNAAVLVVEDESLLRRRIAAYLERAGAEVTQAGSLAEAKRAVDSIPFNFALRDVNLPDGRGTGLLADKVFGSGTSVIVMTAEGGVAGAVEAMRLGAADYLTKPFEIEELPVRFERARRSRQQTRVEEHRRAQDSGGAEEFYFGSSLAGIHAQLGRILEADRRLRSHHPPVLIEGETGTGKTTIARWIHHRGPRAGGPLVEVNGAALPEGLAESELFGHEKGALTDAKSARIGLLEAADGGSLFLDELPSLSPGLQAKLLTALEDHAIRRVGGTRLQAIDVRIIAASNADLRKLVAEGRFREDLYHRLDLFRVEIPPLRERSEDIPEIVEFLLQKLEKNRKSKVKRVAPEAMAVLSRHKWPGNVRELENVIYRSAVVAQGDTILAKDFPPELKAAVGEVEEPMDAVPASEKSENASSEARLAETPAVASAPSSAVCDGLYDQLFAHLQAAGASSVLKQLEQEMLSRALSHFQGNQAQTADFLGLSRNVLKKRAEELGL